MPPEHMELWARRFGIKAGLSGSLSSSPGCLGDPVTAACFQIEYFGWKGTPGAV